MAYAPRTARGARRTRDRVLVASGRRWEVEDGRVRLA